MQDKNIEQVSLDDVKSETVETEQAAPQSETEQLLNQISELNDKYIRSVAELENTRRRSMIDCENTARNRVMSLSKNFLPVMDAIESALSHTPDDEGIISMKAMMNSAFAQTGIVKIEAVGDVLNPAFHNAVQVIESPDAKPNTIISELQTGYMFADTVLRPAMVVVAK